MKLQEKKKKNVQLNIISLIDVVLLLLIFFMLTTRFVEQPGMKLELPKSETSEDVTVDKLELIVSSGSELTLMGKTVAKDDLGSELESFLPQVEDKTLILKADKEVAHGLIVEIMDIARMNGIEKIVIATAVK